MREDSVKQTKSKEKKQLTKKQQKIIAGIGIAVFILVVVVLCIVAIPLIKSLADPDNPEARESFRKWVNEMGIWGRLAYMGLMILQILVAFIPGEPLELMAGYAFGTVEGTILCLLASSIGSILVLLLVRKFGVYLLEIFFSKEKIDSLKFLQESPRTTLIFTVLFIPIGTPKDLLCFYGGLTKIRMWILILVCTLGRFPAIITSTLGGDALENQDFVAAVIVLVVTLALSGIGILVYKLVSRKNDKNQAPVTAPGADSDLDKDKN